METEPSSDKRPAAKNPSAEEKGRKRVKSVACSSSDVARSPVILKGLSSSESEPLVSVELKGLSSSESEPLVSVELKGLSSSESEPTFPVEMKGLTSSDSADSASVEMKGNSYSDGDDSSSYESYLHDSEADNGFEEDSGSMLVAESGAELVEPESSAAELDASDNIFVKLSKLRGELIMGEIPDDVLYGKVVNRRQLESRILEHISEVGASVLKDSVHYYKTPWKKLAFDSTLGYYVIKKPSRFSTMLSESSPLYACLIPHILDLIQNETKKTPESARYWDQTLYATLEQVKAAVDALCLKFECTRSSLRIISGSKGVVKGPLEYYLNDTLIRCGTRQGIPTEDNIPEAFESDACWILVVEKDAIFLRLEDSDFCNRYRCIMVTGKGQANVSTRTFVQSLRRNLKLPVFVLADCNPSGFTIMSTYKHGSEKRALENYRMAVPDIKWLGLHSTDGEKYDILKYGSELSKEDIKSCNDLLEKQCVNEVPGFKSQLEHMLTTNKKYQLEALGISLKSLTRYILDKLANEDWI